MATILASANQLVHPRSNLTAHRRLVPCRPDGIIAQTIDQADELRALGDFENAWTNYTMALRTWLRLQYMSVSGKTELTNDDVYSLCSKLRSTTAIDAWVYSNIKLVLQRPTPATWLHVDLAAGIVKALCRVEGGAA